MASTAQPFEGGRIQAAPLSRSRLLVSQEDDLAHGRSERLAAARDLAAAAVLLRRAEMLRAAAAEDLALAGAERHQAALDRAAASLDDLTGALRRGPGFVALQAEMDRARRSNGSLVLGFVDVDGLKKVNDARGHQAGDRLLCEMVATLRTSLRSYDVVVRVGGDEFVFSLGGTEMTVSSGRLKKLRASVSDIDGDSVTVGFAELRRQDTLATLLARADADLYDRRACRARDPSTHRRRSRRL
jgi:diguanylate cyclase (GGDEF)-like protein